MRARRLLLLTLTAAAMTAAAPLHAQDCAGDCDGDGAVAVGEIVAAVQIALGDVSGAACPAVDGDGDARVTIDELLVAVGDALNGCPVVPTPTATAPPTATPPDAAALAAAARVAVEPLFRIFDVQESILTAVITAGRARRTARAGSDVSAGCQRLDCELSGSLEVCCADGALRHRFAGCRFGDAIGAGTLNGELTIASDSSVLCSGALPLDASFSVALDDFSRDVDLGGGAVLRSLQDLREQYERAPGDCTVSNPNLVGVGIRGSGRRRFDGVLRRVQTDGLGGLIHDSETVLEGVEIAVGATPRGDRCVAGATLAGAVSAADFVAATASLSGFTDLQVVEDPQDDGSVRMQVQGSVDADCTGRVTLATVEPLRLERAKRCFSGGRLEAELGAGRVAATYGAGGTLDLDVDADGAPDQHFATCTEVPLDQCPAAAVPLCGVCDERSECQGGLRCVGCSGDCSGSARRCGFPDASVVCADGVF
ncbi:MAG: hypothetical protein SF182_25915 [Deltaproteobacteria bacterium]|nr:hypothetical protein [Deltaproteobacteria bacterium]